MADVSYVYESCSYCQYTVAALPVSLTTSEKLEYIVCAGEEYSRPHSFLAYQVQSLDGYVRRTRRRLSGQISLKLQEGRHMYVMATVGESGAYTYLVYQYQV